MHRPRLLKRIAWKLPAALAALMGSLALPLPASAADGARCARRQLLHTSYDSDDAVLRIDVYQDGKRLRTFRGRHLGRTVALTRLSSAPRVMIKVVFRLADTHRVILTRTYSRCRGGPLGRRVVSPPRARKEG